MLGPRVGVSFVASFLLAACGGGAKPPSNAVTTAPAESAASAAPSGSAAPAGSAASAAAAPGDPPLEDATESSTPIAMAALLTKASPKATFPKSTVGDKECWQSLHLSGEHAKDFTTIVAACGAPTGLAEYAKPASGKLHHVHDKRDTYTIKLAGGMCYRYFAVADTGITDLDILVQKTSGALVADDKQTSQVAIIESDKAWCMDADAEYEFHIEIEGAGKGGYTFGVWAKPKK
jgi:hypothetical protein